MVKDAIGLLTAAMKAPAAGWRAFVLLAGGFHVAWACSWIPGVQGFALAADQQASEKRLSDRLDAIETKQDIALRLALAAEICRVWALRSGATDPGLRSQLTRSFDEKQDEYARINGGRRYPAAEC